MHRAAMEVRDAPCGEPESGAIRDGELCRGGFEFGGCDANAACVKFHSIESSRVFEQRRIAAPSHIADYSFNRAIDAGCSIARAALRYRGKKPAELPGSGSQYARLHRASLTRSIFAPNDASFASRAS